jgi:hypothetical protein
MLCIMIDGHMITSSTWYKEEWSNTWYKEEWPKLERIWKASLEGPKCSPYILTHILLVCSKYILLQSLREANGLHKH